MSAVFSCNVCIFNWGKIVATTVHAFLVVDEESTSGRSHQIWHGYSHVPHTIYNSLLLEGKLVYMPHDLDWWRCTYAGNVIVHVCAKCHFCPRTLWMDICILELMFCNQVFLPFGLKMIQNWLQNGLKMWKIYNSVMATRVCAQIEASIYYYITHDPVLMSLVLKITQNLYQNDLNIHGTKYIFSSILWLN